MNFCICVVLAFFNFFAKPSPPYEVFSDEIIEQHRKEILEPRNLKYCVMGGGNQDGIKTVHLGIAIKGPGNIEEGRKMVIFLVDDLIRRYNTHPKIRPYLKNYPYTPNNITYKIWYLGSKGDFWVLQDAQYPEKEIAHLGMFRGEVVYSILENDKPTSPLKEIHRETYEKAKKILLDEQGKKILSFFN